MGKMMTTAVLAVTVGGTAFALPGERLVVSAAEVRPDEAAGLYYLGSCTAGYLYNGSPGVLARVAPYRVLDTGADVKDYYLVWAPDAVTLESDAFRRLGFAVKLGLGELLVGVAGGAGAEAIRAVEYRAELVKLEPLTPVESTYKGEPPPAVKDPAIEAAINTITEAEISGYVQTLQDFKTRYHTTVGNVATQEYLYDFFVAQGLSASYFGYPCLGDTHYDVIGEKVGSSSADEVVIISAHLDSRASGSEETSAPGAEDDASGIACVMAAARALKGLPLKRTVRYVGFNCEEATCRGSFSYARYCAKTGVKIVTVMHSDMVFYDEENGGRDDYAVANERYTWLYEYLKGVGGLYGQNLIYDPKGYCSSDQFYFWYNKYPAIAVIEGYVGTGGGQHYPFYHTTRDTLDKLHPALGVRFARDYAAMLAHLARSEYAGVNDPYRAPAPRKPYAFSYYPNPYHLTSGRGGITFKGIAAPAELVIYDLAGRKVAAAKVPAGQEEFVWAPAAGGATLAPGIYLFRVEGEGQREVGKLAVVR